MKSISAAKADKVRQTGHLRDGLEERKIMKFAIRAALAALSIGSIPPAFAEESGSNPNASLIERPGIVAEAPAQNAPAGTQRGSELQGHTQSSRSPWLFPPIGKYLDQPTRG
jgi:hypothetical protein